ncbi:MAG: SpoIIE family protein phosphatase [Eubacterium sp.]|nr:SpoIIE family protein phosphatase [Eubacterium sp.]
MNNQDKNQRKKERKQNRRLFSVISIRLILIGVIGMAGLFLVLGFLFLEHEKAEAHELIIKKLHDVREDSFSMLEETVNMSLSDDAVVVEMLKNESGDLSKKLRAYQEKKYLNGSCEISVIDKNGIITASTKNEYIGIDIHDEDQFSELIPLVEHKTTFVMNDLERDSNDAFDKTLFAAMPFSDGDGFLELEYSRNGVENIIDGILARSVSFQSVGKDGYMMTVNREGMIISCYKPEYLGKNISESGLSQDRLEADNNKVFRMDVFGEDSWVVSGLRSGITIVGVLPISEMIDAALRNLLAFSILLIFIIIVIFVVVFVILKRNVIDSIKSLDVGMTQIAEGNLEQKVDVYSTKEFKILSDGINDMVDSLRGYIREEKERVDKELEVAREIQLSSMPPAGSAFSDETRFAVYATINTAKDVGGDFYDFYMIGNTLCFLIADVSGKGIPAAMFMMRAKTVIKNYAESGEPPASVFTLANKKLCEENDTGMFLTVWMGFLDITTGLVKFVNAGHNPPLLIRDGKPEYQKVKPGLLMGTLDMARYRENEIQLQPGDALYLYTDGVTESVNPDDMYYGEDRLREVLSGEIHSVGKDYCREVCRDVLLDVNGFAGDAEQADDITMLCLRYEGETT